MPEQILLATRNFSMEDSKRFAQFSGDANPMHMDAVAARCMPAGEPVVHGVHLLLWALEVAFRLDDGFLHVRARFQKPVVVGDRVELREARDSLGASRLRLSVNGIVVIRIDIAGPPIVIPPNNSQSPPSTPALDRFDAPIDLALDEMRGRNGRISTSTLQTDAARLFPNISLAIGEGRVAALARLSTLVGMVCPGLHSIFGSLDISFDGPQTETVDFIVTDVDDHFRLISQSVAGSGIRGNIKAFARVPPVKQLSMAAVAGSVKRGEFAGSVALVAGGSRGLGALVARIVAAGGGRVIITYAVGLEEARTVQADICDAGARCELLQYDALSPNVMELIAELPAITHFYYFASPKISAKRSIDPFAPDLFNRFISFYVTGFQRLCEKRP